MNKYYILFVFAWVPFTVFSQFKPIIKTQNQTLEMTSLQVQVQVIGNVATTTYDMLFYNPTSQILEGELNFPLGEHQDVVRLALEINGKLREAVVVEKELGRVAFEAVVRRGVDPVLLEKVSGNNYKARIYPIPANGHKRVVLAYDQTIMTEDGFQKFNLSLDFQKTLDQLDLNISVFNVNEKPILTTQMQDLAFQNMQNHFVADFHKSNYYCEGNLEVKIPIVVNTPALIRDDNYFYWYQTLELESVEKVKPKTIDLFWDASLSMKDRDLEKELELLERYFQLLKNVKVQATFFSNEILNTQTYTIHNAQWDDLKSDLMKVVYDGGTDYGNLISRVNPNSECTLLFSDGMSSMSTQIPQFSNEVYLISSILKSDPSLTTKIGTSKKATYINLQETKPAEALKRLAYKKYELMGVETDHPECDIYPKQVQLTTNELVLTGNQVKTGQKISLLLGLDSVFVKKIDYIVPQEKVVNPKLGKLWATHKLKYLQSQKVKDTAAIVTLSKEFNLISDFTSLIVLDDVRDYVRYRISPPDELKEQYETLVALEEKAKNESKWVTSSTNASEQSQNQTTQTQNRTIIAGNGSMTVSGIVQDQSGPLPGVSVLIKGTNMGTETDFDGMYSIQVNQGDILVFSYVGMVTLEADVNQNSININMSSDENVLDEVVVTALGIRKEKKSLGYASSAVNSEEITASNSSVSDLLQGEVAGLQVQREMGRYGTSPNVMIRGFSSFSNKSQPLYVIDGTPVESDRLEELVDPNDIESITVLKGVAASAIYGSRAINGVIVIDLKDGDEPQNRNNFNSSNSNSRRQRNQSDNEEEISTSNSQIKINKYSIKVPEYLKAFEKCIFEEDYYETYLKQRERYIDQPMYFVDIFDEFLQKGYTQKAFLILSNLLELEIDSYEHIRLFAYKSEEGGNLKAAENAYLKVLSLRPEDTQSYRDLALVQFKNEKTEKAIKGMKFIVSGEVYLNRNRRNFEGMNQIASVELEQMKQKSGMGKTETSDIKVEGWTQDTFDLRVVIDWNHNDTDIDLYVTDPDQETCYYSHNTTKMGGKMSRDMTQGFGPEEFTLRHAKPGSYSIKINYFGDRYQKLDNPTFLKVSVFKHYGTPNQTEEIKVFRLEGSTSNIQLDEVTF
jgi:TonB-dependent SusC/RagA subfamily outer membrane receptor